MNTNANMEEQLWNYIDGACSASEKSFIEQLLETNQEWRSKYKELLEVHQLMQGSIELDEPSLRFTQNVMEEIAKHQIARATRTYINKRIVWGIAAFFIISLLGFIIYGFGQVSWTASGDSQLNQSLNKLNLDYSKIFNNAYTNVFIMINIVLGLILLDMYLGKKKKEYLKH
jgi:anti-sigma factor RsiW